MSHKKVLIILLGLCCILCFANQNFEMTIDRVEMVDIDPEIIVMSYAVNKYNRTFKTLTANFTLLKDMGYDVKLKLQGYAMFSNEYRRVPLTITRNVCDFHKYEFLWIKNQITKYSNFPTKCPLLAGDYYLKDFAPNGADFPAVANAPWSKFMLELQNLYKAKHFITIKFYTTLDHDAQLKREG